MMGRMKTTVGPLGVLGALLVCLPCLLPVIAVLGGVAVFTALGGFIMDNALTLGLGSGGVTASLATAAYIMLARRRHSAACESLDAQAMLAIGARRTQP